MSGVNYSPNLPMKPLLREIVKRRDEDMREIDQSHPLQRIAANEQFIGGLTWLLDKLVAERDAALAARVEAAAAIGAAPREEG